MPSWKKVIVSGSDAALNSLTVTNGITGSVFGTASFASNGGVTQLLAGPNVTLSPTNGKGQVTVSSTSGGGGFNTATGSYGSFYDTTTQTNPVANIARSMSLNTTDITNGVSVSGSTNPFNTYIKTENAGVYNIQFSAQVDKTDSGADEIVIWLRKNGSDLTDTATTVTLSGNNDKQVAAWNWFVNSAANDYYQIIWYSADTDLRLLAETAGGGHPGIPSVIVTANRVDQFLSNTGSFSGSFTGVFTGSLFGTSSYATSASQAISASFAINASSSLFAVSSSRALSASFATLAASATTATTATNANTASNITPAITNTANNRVLTDNGGGTINAESALTFDGSTLTTTGTISGSNIYSSQNVEAAVNLKSLNSSGDEGGEIFLNKAVTNTTLTGGVTIDVWQNRLRFFEQGGTARGYFLDISSGSAGVSTNLASGGGTVTSVGGTGTVNGLTLTGNVSGSGNLTLGGTLSNILTSSLAQSGSTIGSTFVGLGSTVTTLAGLTSVTATNFTGTASYATSASQAINSTTSTQVIGTVTGTNTTELVRGNMADNDQFRILVGGTATNAGYVELATADDGTEPIYVRQYTGVFSSLARTATLLDGSGNTQFPGSVSASSFLGPLTGTSSYATSASQAISSSFATNASSSLFAVSSSRAVSSSFATVAQSVLGTITNANTASNITPAITNAANDRILTANGGGTINGESNLTFDGTTLIVVGKLENGNSGCVATGTESHAEGKSTTATGNWSHAEGGSTYAVGDGSHAEGDSTSAMGILSHAEGEQAYTEGYASHAEGVMTSASGDYSHAEGEGTLAKGYASHAEGGFTYTGGDYSHAAGIYTSASADYQSVIGNSNKPSPNPSAFIIGNGTGPGNESNLLYASGSNVQITGSLYVSRSDNDQLSAIFATRGSKTNPAYTFIGDEDTGMFRDSANTLGLTAGSQIRLIASDTQLYLNPGTTTFQENILTISNDTIPLVSKTPRGDVSVGLSTSSSCIEVTDTTSGTGPYYLMFADGTTGYRTTRVDSSTLTFNATSNTLTVANLTGTASYATTATNALNARVIDNTSTNATYYIPFVDATSGNKTLNVDSSNLTFNPSTNTLTVTNLIGNASTATSSSMASNITVTDTTSGTGPYYLMFADGTTGLRNPRVDSSTLTFNATTNTLTVTNLTGTASSATSASFAINASSSLFAVSSSRSVSSSFAASASRVTVTTSNANSDLIIPFINHAANIPGAYSLLMDDSNNVTYNPSSNILSAPIVNAQDHIFGYSMYNNNGTGIYDDGGDVAIGDYENNNPGTSVTMWANGNNVMSVNYQTAYISHSLGISTTSPQTKLHVEDVTKTLTGNVAGVAQGTLSLVSTDAQAADKGASLLFGGNYINSNSSKIAFAAITGRKSNSTNSNADGYLSFLTWRGTGLTEAMRITSDGNVGIGTTGPSGVWSGTHRTLQITGGTNTSSELVQSRPSATITRFLSGTSSEFGVYTADALNYTIYTSGNERMRITSAGSMGLGITAPTATAGRFEASNDIVAFSTSDKRWKNNIVKIDSPLEKISQISGVEFDWIEDEPLHGNKGHDVGVIAQEIELVIPEAVQTRESGMKAVQYDKIIPLLIESIKEQQKQIDELKELVNKLTK
jgi:hypothetical protein